MEVQAFKKLVGKIQSEFSPFTGSLAQCGGKPGKTLSICCSSTRNTGLVCSQCIVWNHEKIKYEGKLDSARLRHLLDRWCICRAVVTTVADMEEGNKGHLMCLGDPSSCRKTKCPLHVCHNTEGSSNA